MDNNIVKDPVKEEGDSILLSVKSLLGISSEDTSFDLDCIININSAIMILTQLGVGPENGFEIKGAEETYSDFLGDPNPYSGVKMYLFLKTKLGFDSQTTPSAVLEVYKEQIRELEWRMKTISEYQKKILENSK